VHEADIFRRWLIDHLAPDHAVEKTCTAVHAEATADVREEDTP
jgi:hypothetical protein